MSMSFAGGQGGAMVPVRFVPVQVNGDTLLAGQDGEGNVWVSLRRCCENLGVAMQSQLRKLRGERWATVIEMITANEDGHRQTVTAIHLDSVPLWLSSIKTGKVRPEIREKLEVYKCEAARVLADHFLRRPPAPAIASQIDVGQVASELAIRLAADPNFVAAVRQAMGGLQPAAAVPQYTINERLEYRHILNATRKYKSTVYRRATQNLNRMFGEPTVLLGRETVWAAHRLLALDAAIDQTEEDGRKEERKQGSMFQGFN